MSFVSLDLRKSLPCVNFAGSFGILVVQLLRRLPKGVLHLATCEDRCFLGRPSVATCFGIPDSNCLLLQSIVFRAWRPHASSPALASKMAHAFGGLAAARPLFFLHLRCS